MGNQVLYDLCADHPNHDTDEAIIAKFWLIGRAYAAAAERRRKNDGHAGDDFYTKSLLPVVRESEIDSWFATLKADHKNSPNINIRIHKQFVDLLSPITDSDKRSLASKYLHFHFPNRFFLYDLRATNALSEFTPGFRHRSASKDADKLYASFYHRCELLKPKLEQHLNRTITHRELDCILVGWSDRTRESAEIK